MIDRICADFQPDAVAVPAQDAGAADHDGPLDWPGYDRQRASARERTGSDESVVTGRGLVGGQQAVVIAFEFGFLGGSVGREAGSRLVGAFDRAGADGLPVVSLIASGGSRVQEGICALTQLQHISRACERARRAGVAHIAVARDPTTGGMWASLAAGADVVLGLAGAEVSFGGSRVRSARSSDAEAFGARAKLDSGQIDQVLTADELPGVLERLVRLLAPGRRSRHAEPADVPRALGVSAQPESGMAAVHRARAAARPRAHAYLADHFTDRVVLRGDRAGGTAPGVECGFGERAGQTVAYVAQNGTTTAAAGFREAARTIRLADRLGLPVLTLVDTPGAANDAEAERAAVGPAIAEAFASVAEAAVPVTTLVIGQGGSGGALALCAPDRTWLTPDAYFAVTAPEAAAAILKVGDEHVPEVADQLRLRPQDLVELGFARGIVEPGADSRRR